MQQIQTRWVLYVGVAFSVAVAMYVTTTSAQANSCEIRPATLTGYFTPIDTDYVKAAGDILPFDFLRLFVVQWMGITERFGVIGLWDSDGDGKVNVHINLPCPLDAHGECLVAYDPNFPDRPGTAASNTLAPGTLLRVGGPTGNLYKITDTIGVTNGHDESLLIDIYFGEGNSAHEAAKDVVRLDGSGEVCVY